MANRILAVLEQREGKLKKTAAEVITAAKKLAEDLNGSTEAVVVGNDISNIEEIAQYGAGKVIHYHNSQLENYSASAYSKIIAGHAEQSGADIIIMAHSSLGVDLAPHIAVKMNGGILTDCIEFRVNDGNIEVVRPVYAGKALLEAKLNTEKKVFTIRPNIFKPVETSGSSFEVEKKEATDPDLRVRVTSFKKSEGKIDVAEADIIVSGGRGLKGPENFHLVEELAAELGAAVGASRAVVDAGWRPHREQVGQTGKTVSPTLYIACGISGAVQHLAGMSSSKYIVAINKDKDAPIFSVADYGIAGDIFEILPALTQEIKKIKQ
jgi:electron transfer flavoprotein alpha subunit